MTKSEAVRWLREYRDANTLLNVQPRMYPRLNNGISEFEMNVYLDGLVNKLMHDIYVTDVDPLTIVADAHYKFDEVLAESDEDHLVTIRFSSYMESLAHDIYWYLKEKEKKYENLGRD